MASADGRTLYAVEPPTQGIALIDLGSGQIQMLLRAPAAHPSDIGWLLIWMVIGRARSVGCRACYSGAGGTYGAAGSSSATSRSASAGGRRRWVTR
jgi:hypothetical protein